MQGLDLTFDTLAKSRNEAAVDLLLAVLVQTESGQAESGQAESGASRFSQQSRRLALRALTIRKERMASEKLLAIWSSLNSSEVEIIEGRRSWMAPAIEAFLSRGADETRLAIEAAESLSLTEVLPTLIAMVHASAEPELRPRLSAAIRRIIEPLGVSARSDRDRATVRGPLMIQLAESIRACPDHCGELLGEAFLAASSWTDTELQSLLHEQTPASERIFRLLAESTDGRVLELLTGFLRRREIPGTVRQILVWRDDETCRAALLRAIGCDPTQTVLRNLREMGMPQACRLSEDQLLDLPLECRASLVHVHTACNPDLVQTLHFVAATAELGTRNGVTAAAAALSRCEVPSAEDWIQAALSIDASGISSSVDRVSLVGLLQRLVRLLEHPDSALVRGVRRVLAALHAEELLSRIEVLSQNDRRSLGAWVKLVDPEATDRVRDALRHPVLARRLSAIAMADAIDAVDQLAHSFSHITRDDHQEARTRAAEAMSRGKSRQTLDLLKEMLELPSCPVRDAAVAALRQRQQSPAVERSYEVTK